MMDSREFQRTTNGYYDNYPSYQYRNYKRLNFSSDQNHGSIRRNRTWYPIPGQGSLSQDRSYSNKSPYYSHLSHRDIERDSLLYKSRNSNKHSANIGSSKLRQSRAEHSLNYDTINPEKMVARSVKWSNSGNSRDSREPGQQIVVHRSYQSRSSSSNNVKSKSGRSSALIKIGDWCKRTSSSGDKYYYNCKTNVSQWNNPREWLETYSASQPSQTQYNHDKHSNNSIMKSSSMSNHVTKFSQQVNFTNRPTHRTKNAHCYSDKRRINVSQSQHVFKCDSSQTHAKELYNGKTTPTSKMSIQLSKDIAAQRQSSSTSKSQAKRAKFISEPCGKNDDVGFTTSPLSNITQNLVGSSTINNITRQTLPITANIDSNNTQEVKGDSSQTQVMEFCTSDCTPTPEMSFRLSKDVRAQRQSSSTPQSQSFFASVKVSAINSEQYERTNVDVGLTALSNITQNLLGSSITTHCAKPSSLTPASTTTINTQEVKRNPVTSHAEQVIQVNNVMSYRQHGKTTYPIFSNFVRNDLTSHVKFWPTDILEKEAQKLNKKAQILGNVHCSLISTELKHARSIVRLNEVNASILQLKLLHIQEKIKILEQSKSENLFMAE